MRYISTRGYISNKNFSDIMLEGLAPDGGLYLPNIFPVFTKEELDSFRTLSYAALAFEIFKKFEVDIPDKILKNILEKTYNRNIFRYSRSKGAANKITPIVKLNENLYIQELSNGPTLAFKDMAMQLLGNIFEYVLNKKKQKLNILGATSGDTGSAAEYAFKDKKNINVFMLSPHGKMSNFQRAQMYSLMDENIFNIAVKGMFDDAQDLVKEISLDKKFKTEYNIGAVNSINFGRILAQVVYYFKGYLKSTKNSNEFVNFAVPTGNFGNIYAGHVAKMCGLPIHKLILATNENDVLNEFFNTGIYRPRTSNETFVTTSPSMDISKASNFERFLFDLFGKNTKKVKNLMKEVRKKGYFDISKTKEYRNILKFGFVAGRSTHKNRIETIRKVFDNYKITIDPHTADALFVGEKYADNKTIILETAQPEKFEETVREAIGKKFKGRKEFSEIQTKIQKVYISNIDKNEIKKLIQSHGIM